MKRRGLVGGLEWPGTIFPIIHVIHHADYFMELIQNVTEDIRLTKSSDPYAITYFQEKPGKTGMEKPVARIGAFELFNLFTADIIRSKEVFTR